MGRRAVLCLLVPLFVACSASGGGGPPAAGGSGTAGENERTAEMEAEQLAAGAPGQGPGRPRVVVAPSAADLSAEVGGRVPDSGDGAYLAAFWGRKTTGGYSVSVAGARREGGTVTVELVLERPPPDAVVTQALTYPYAVAVVRGAEAGGDRFAFVDGTGRELGWPVEEVGD